MPNHVHALFKVGETPLSKIVGEVKEYTAREANKILDRRGKFWAEDCWDTCMLDAQHELKTRRYIENNPAKAFLVRDPKEWPWSSARFCDEGRHAAPVTEREPSRLAAVAKRKIVRYNSNVVMRS